MTYPILYARILRIVGAMLLPAGVASAYAAQVPAPAPTPALVTTDLCAEGVEGSFVGRLEQRDVRLNLICIDATRLTASLTITLKGSTHTILGFGNSAIVDGELIMATYGIPNAERRGASSKTAATYLRLDIAALRAKRARGVLVTRQADRFRVFDLPRAHTFPRITGVLGADIPKSKIRGSYTIPSSPYGPARLLVDVLGDTPSLNLKFDVAEVIHMIDGAVWDGSGLLSSSSPQGDGEPDGQKLFYLRGRMINERELEVYFVTNVHGLTGPHRALRE